MNHFRILPMAFIILSASVGGAETYRMTHQAELIPEKMENSLRVWDMSDNQATEKTEATMYLSGDSLYSETLCGIRRWYAMREDSVFFVREESLTEALVPVEPLPTAALGSEGLTGQYPYLMRSANSASMTGRRAGTYRSFQPVKGLLVIGPGDTVPSVMTRERIMYRETFSPDTLDESKTDNFTGAPAGEDEVEIKRWFTDEKLPTAIHFEQVCPPYGEEEEYRMSFTCLRKEGNGNPEPENTPQLTEDEMRDIVEAAFSGMSVSATGGEISIIIRTPYELTLTLDVLADNGIPYLHREFKATDGVPVTFPCPEVPAGRRLTVISGYGCRESRNIRFR